MKKLIAICFLLGSMLAVAQSQPTCTAGAIQIVSGLSVTVYTDTTVVNGQTYSYTVIASDPFGVSACSNIAGGNVIPATGTHSVALSWTASTTNGVTYAVFRATPPTPPSALTSTVN